MTVCDRRYGADLHAQAWNGKTPLDLAEEYENRNVAEVLREAARTERARMPWLKRLVWRRPRTKMDEDGIRADRSSFLQALTEAYPEQISQKELDVYEKQARQRKEDEERKRKRGENLALKEKQRKAAEEEKNMRDKEVLAARREYEQLVDDMLKGGGKVVTAGKSIEEFGGREAMKEDKVKVAA